ncbi:CHAT domain-containing protein [Leptolyngbyaceae cyanobacterium CCMR0081]|uniref:CHAT domain-containing protein n=2 Tax=Adonisia TaxID=2950183 RepID=A0A6M0RSD3_9CYAN|nr:CHAT domain-containing protein [Adonisia turfae CCMR0081]
MAMANLRYVLIGCLILWLTLGTGRTAAQITVNGNSEQGVINCTIPDRDLSLSQAQTLYESGCYNAAATVLETVSQQGDSINQAIALSNLSLTQQQLGNWQLATDALKMAFERIEVSNADHQAAIQAQALDVQGQLQLARGQAAAAATSWEQAAQLYTQLDQPNRAALSQIKQARSLQTLGLFQQVKVILVDVAKSLREQPTSDGSEKAIALRQLADVLWMTGASEISLHKSDSSNEQQTRSVQSLLKESLNIGRELNRTDITAAATLSLGNFYRHQFFKDISQPTIDHQKAYKNFSNTLFIYDQVINETSNRPSALQALLNQLSFKVNADIRDWLSEAKGLSTDQQRELQTALEPTALQASYDTAKTQLSILRPGRQTVYAHVNLAESLLKWQQMKWQQNQPLAIDGTEILALLKTAEAQARQLDDKRALSSVLGHQGQLYGLYSKDSQGPWQNAYLETATILTRQALSQAQAIGARDISYQWQHQLGRLLTAQGDRDGAIAAYKGAFDTLQTLRSDLIAVNSDQRFYFRDNIEPIYRELVALLLPPTRSQQSKANADGVQTSQQDLDLVRKVMDALQVAELENFFQAACVDTTTELGKTLQPGDAGIYPILLDHRLEVVLQLPMVDKTVQQANTTSELTEDYTLQRFSSNVEKADIEQLLSQIRRNLDSSNPGAVRQFERASERLYTYLFEATEIGPQTKPQTLAIALENALANSSSKTLVFVLDGPFRAIPLGTLYDGENYLLEKYAIALNLGIEVRESTTLPNGADLKVLAAGVRNPPIPFEDYVLPNVTAELEKIQTSGASVKLLQEEDFTRETFNQQLNDANYQIVHLATHGQFASNREDTYILADDERLPVDELNALFRNTQAIQNPIELIIFSACRTATGDNRAVLGLAGATVQSGARSAIAALWSVDDAASVPFAEAFYQHLEQPDTSRAVALQQAQLTLKEEYTTPRYWAPYVLVGSWR